MYSCKTQVLDMQERGRIERKWGMEDTGKKGREKEGKERGRKEGREKKTSF